MAQVLWTTSHQFEIYYDTSLDATTGATACNALAQNVFVDYQILSSWFGGIALDHFDLHIYPKGTYNGAEHFDCGARDIHLDFSSDADFDRMLVASEVTEVFEANFDGDWDCGNSCGEALSRALAETLYPGKQNGIPVMTWGNSAARKDWIQQNDESDTHFDSIGCALLFLNWLRFQVGYRWEQIVAAGKQITDLNPERLYHALTGAPMGTGWNTFKAFIDSQFPPGSSPGLGSNNPFPIYTGQQWSPSWQPLGSPAPGLNLTFAPAVSSRASNALDVVAVGGDNAAWVLTWDGVQGWHSWKNAGGTLTAGPGAVSVRTASSDLYARATDGTLYAQEVGAQLSGWRSLGGSAFEGAPAVVSWAPYRIDIFAISNGQLLHRYSTDYGKTFKAWESLQQPTPQVHLVGVPAVVSRGPRKLDVFVGGSDGSLWTVGWDSSAWAPWARAPLPPGRYAPFRNVGVSAWWPDRLDLFVVNQSGGINHMYKLSSTSPWVAGDHFGPPPNTSIASGPTAFSWGPNRIDVFVIGADHNLWQLWWG